MQSPITEIRFTSPGGKVNVYLFCKPQYILESSPAGPVAKGLWGNSPPPLRPQSLLSNPPTPLQIAWVYVPGPPVNFLSRVHRYADISGINLVLRIVMLMQMYTRLLSCDCLLYVWVLVHTGNIPLCLCGQHRQGQDWHVGQVEAKLCPWGLSSGQQIGHSWVFNAVTAACCYSTWWPCEQF